MAPHPHPNRNQFQRVVTLASKPELEAAKVIGGRVGQDESATIAVELDVMTGAEE